MSQSAFATALARVMATLALGALGGWVAALLGLPLPWMLGSLITVTGLAVGGASVGGHHVHVPRWLRNVMVMVIGVVLGGSFTPDVAGRMAGWWPTLLSLLIFIVASTLLVYQLYRRLFGFDRITAYCAAVPGGLIEMAIIGESMGGNGPKISLIHFCRIVLAVLAMPFVLAVLHGPVGEVEVAGPLAETGLDPLDVVILAACAVGGYFAAGAVRMPGAVISGPLIASALAHAAGLTAAVPPAQVVTVAQVIVGAGLGAGFAMLSVRDLLQALRAAAAASLVMISVTIAVALAMVTLVDAPLAALLLALAPGGFVEMSLIALAVGTEIAFVAAHHVARIVLSVLVMPLLWQHLIAPWCAERDASRRP